MVNEQLNSNKELKEIQQLPFSDNMNTKLPSSAAEEFVFNSIVFRWDKCYHHHQSSSVWLRYFKVEKAFICTNKLGA